MALSIGVDEMTIGNWERHKQLPRRFKRVRLAFEVLGVDFGEVIEEFYGSEVETGFGLTLQEARITQGLTQEKAAREAGVDPTTLRRWERSPDASNGHDREIVVKVCGFLGVTT